jgi:heme oxygenase
MVLRLQSRGEPVVPIGKPVETLAKAVGWLYVGKSPKLCGYFAMFRRLEQVSPRHPALHEKCAFGFIVSHIY